MTKQQFQSEDFEDFMERVVDDLQDNEIDPSTIDAMDLFIDFLDENDVNITSTSSATILAYLVKGIGQDDSSYSESIQYLLNNMTIEALHEVDCYGSNVLHYAVENEDALMQLLADERLDNLLFEKNIYGYTPLQMALINGLEDEAETIADKMNVDIEAEREKIKLHSRIDQEHINSIILQYLEKMGRDSSSVINKAGECNGLSFLYLYYVNNGKEKQFYDVLSFISDLKLVGDQKNITNILRNKKLPKKLAKSYKSAEDLMEQTINDIVMFSHQAPIVAEMNLQITLAEREKQLKLVGGQQATSNFSEISNYYFHDVSMKRLKSIIDLLATHKENNVELSLIVPKLGMSHIVSFSLDSDGKFNYYDPNVPFKMAKFESSEELANHIFKYFKSWSSKMLDRYGLEEDRGAPIDFQVREYSFSKNINTKLDVVSTDDAHQNMKEELKLSKLHYAVFQNDFKVLNEEIGTAETEKDAFGLTALMWAAQQKDIGPLSLLLKKSSEEKINTKDKRGFSALSYAIFSGNIAAISALLENKAEMNFLDSKGMTLLSYAVMSNNQEIINELLHHGADINMPTSNGLTPLFICANANTLQSNKTAFDLIDKGAKLDDSFNINEQRYTLFDLALNANNLSLGEKLLESGFLINRKDNEADDEAPIFKAIKAGNIKFVDMLIKYGANINMFDDKQRAALLKKAKARFGDDIAAKLFSSLQKTNEKGLNENAHSSLKTSEDRRASLVWTEKEAIKKTRPLKVPKKDISQDQSLSHTRNKDTNKPS